MVRSSLQIAKTMRPEMEKHELYIRRVVSVQIIQFSKNTTDKNQKKKERLPSTLFSFYCYIFEQCCDFLSNDNLSNQKVSFFYDSELDYILRCFYNFLNSRQSKSTPCGLINCRLTLWRQTVLVYLKDIKLCTFKRFFVLKKCKIN